MDAPSALDWTLEPVQLALLVLVGALYAGRARTLRRRGQPVPRARRVSFAIGLALAFVAFASPLDEIGAERLFAFHMLQHVLLGDVAALAVVAGLTGPLLRPLLAVPPVERLRILGHPLVALPVWALNLFLWHLPPLYEAALSSDLVHALQHVLFFTTGAFMWAPVVEVLPGPVWFGTAAKFGYVVVVRLLETVLGNVFLWTGEPVYDTYAEAPRLWGLSPEGDQAIAGGIMMLEGSLVTIGALAWLFLRLAAEGELRQQLIERGLDPAVVRRAVRYGRGDLLEREAGGAPVARK